MAPQSFRWILPSPSTRCSYQLLFFFARSNPASSSACNQPRSFAYCTDLFPTAAPPSHAASDRVCQNTIVKEWHCQPHDPKIDHSLTLRSLPNSVAFTALFRRVSGRFRYATSGSVYLNQSFRSFSHQLGRVQELQECIDRSVSNIPLSFPNSPLTEDLNGLYAGMTSKELLDTLFNLHLVAYEPFVDFSREILNSPLMQKYEAFRRLVFGIVKKTAYSHFCAGSCVAQATGILKRTSELGMKGILDCSLEDAMDNSSCDRNLLEFLETIRQAQQLPPRSVSFACVKITALCPRPLLVRTSNLLRWEHTHADVQLPWKEDALPLFAEESAPYHVVSPPDPLSAQEESDFLVSKERLWKVCQACDAVGLPLLVDAEYTSVQPAIDYLTYTAALHFNRNGHPLVYGTVQAYLKDALPRLTVAVKEASNRGVAFGIKLVRGAYITKETALAASMDAPSPIHSCIEDTHNCYDTCAAFMMKHVKSGRGAVVLATHNFDSGRAAVTKAEELGLLKGSPRLQFAQLKGMADGLSLALVHAGFRVSKYLPLGSVEDVIPYLLRRAEENRGLLANTSAERTRIRRELTRRLVWPIHL